MACWRFPEVSSKTIMTISWALNGHKLYKLHIHPQNLHKGVPYPSLTHERHPLRIVRINDTKEVKAINTLLTCKPITLWPAFNFPSSKRLVCFSAYLTPMSMVVWNPFVLA